VVPKTDERRRALRQVVDAVRLLGRRVDVGVYCACATLLSLLQLSLQVTTSLNNG